MEIYLVRHTSVDVPPHTAYGQTDVPLMPSFEQEAAAVKEQLDGIAFDHVYTSPLTRCVRLATYCGYADAKREPRVMEISFGEWEMMTWDEISADPRSEAWYADWESHPIPGGESLSDQLRRVSAFVDELRRSGDQRVCVFCHGGILTCARIYAGLYPLSDAFKNIPPYGSVITLSFD